MDRLQQQPNFQQAKGFFFFNWIIISGWTCMCIFCQSFRCGYMKKIKARHCVTWQGQLRSFIMVDWAGTTVRIERGRKGMCWPNAARLVWKRQVVQLESICIRSSPYTVQQLHQSPHCKQIAALVLVALNPSASENKKSVTFNRSSSWARVETIVMFTPAHIWKSHVFQQRGRTWRN